MEPKHIRNMIANSKVGDQNEGTKWTTSELVPLPTSPLYDI
jgi:hypothetical protein